MDNSYSRVVLFVLIYPQFNYDPMAISLRFFFVRIQVLDQPKSNDCSINLSDSIAPECEDFWPVTPHVS